MSSWQIDIHPAAIAEAQAAAGWYRERSSSAADAFLVELDSAINRIAENPRQWSRYVRGTQHYLMRRFPFHVVYRQTPGRIEIIAVAHGRRRPGYWKNRVRTRSFLSGINTDIVRDTDRL